MLAFLVSGSACIAGCGAGGGQGEVHESRPLANSGVYGVTCDVDTTRHRDPVMVITGCRWSLTFRAGDAEPRVLESGPPGTACEDVIASCTRGTAAMAVRAGTDHDAIVVVASIATAPHLVYVPHAGASFEVPLTGAGGAAELLATAPPFEEAIRRHLAMPGVDASDPVWALLTPDQLPGLIDVVVSHLGATAPRDVVVAALAADPEQMSRPLFDEALRDPTYGPIILAHPLVNEEAMILEALRSDAHAPGYLPDRRGDVWLAQLSAERHFTAAGPLLEARLPALRFGSTFDDPELARWVRIVRALDALDPDAAERLELDALARVPGDPDMRCVPLTDTGYDGNPTRFGHAVGVLLAGRDTPTRRAAILAMGRAPTSSGATRHMALWLLRFWRDPTADQISDVSLAACQIPAP